MAYRGHVKNGVVELDEPAFLPEGAEVSVDLVPTRNAALGETESVSTEKEASIPSLYDQFKDIVGIIEEGLPEDLAMNHDHYLYGTPKK